MKAKSGLYLFTLLSALVLFGSSSPSKFRTYYHKSSGVSFDLPDTWHVLYSKRQDGLICIPTLKSEKQLYADCYEGIIFRLKFYHSGLDSALVSTGFYEKKNGAWYTRDRVSDSVSCVPVKGSGWMGIWHENICGIGCSDGFHAVAGRCDNLWMSNGKVTLSLETNGYPLEPAILNRIKSSVRFRR